MNRFFPALFAVAFVLPCAAPSDAAELNVEEHRWNLGGPIRQGAFNSLLLNISNVSNEEFDGDLEIVVGSRLSPEQKLRQRVYLAPDQTQRVYFDVNVRDYFPGLFVVWGRREDQVYEVPPESFPNGRPPTRTPVTILDDGLTTVGSGAASRLPDQWFPPSAVSLPAEGVVVLDHDPRWQSSQRQALLDWVGLGGELRLFERGGRRTELSGELAVLNAFDGELIYGAGRVVRERRGVGELDRTEWTALAGGGGADQGEEPTDEEIINSQAGGDPSDRVFQGLALLHQPDFNWPLIFLLFAVYIAALVGGSLAVSRRTRSWQRTYLTLAATVALFSVLFWQLGARGHGERSEVSTVALADVLPDGRLRARAWTNHFTVRSRVITMSPMNGRAGLRPRELGGLVVSGGEAFIRRSIPAFSSLTLQWQGVGDGNVPEVTGVTLEEDKLSFTIPQGRSIDAWVKSENSLHACTARAARDAPGTTYTCRLDDAGVDENNNSRNPWSRGMWRAGRGRKTGSQQFRNLLLQSAAEDLTDVAVRNVGRRTLPEDRLDLLIFSEVGPSITAGLGDGDALTFGRVLYRIPLHVADDGTISGPGVGTPEPETTSKSEAPPTDDEASPP